MNNYLSNRLLPDTNFLFRYIQNIIFLFLDFQEVCLTLFSNETLLTFSLCVELYAIAIPFTICTLSPPATKAIGWCDHLKETRMHSSRMRTARSSSRVGGEVVSAPVHAGIPPWVWAWIPPRYGPGDPLGVGLETPLGVGLETPPGQTPQLPPWVWAWRPARHAGIPPTPRDLLQGMLGYHPPLWTESQTRVKT